jgi:hypothetical protein
VKRHTRASCIADDKSSGWNSVFGVAKDKRSVGGPQERRAKRKSFSIGAYADLIAHPVSFQKNLIRVDSGR